MANPSQPFGYPYFAWQAATALGIQREQGLERFVTAQLYYSLAGRDLEHEWIPLAEYAGLGVLVWSPLAGGYLTGKYKAGRPAPEGTRFAEAGQFVPVDEDRGQRVLEALRQVSQRYDASPARVSLAWTLRRPAISSVIIAARSLRHIKDDIRAVDLKLADEDVALLDEASDPGTLYPRWMVRQINEGEDPRSRVLDPRRFEEGDAWQDLRDRTE